MPFSCSASSVMAVIISFMVILWCVEAYAQLADTMLCADESCSETISQGEARLAYRPKDEKFLHLNKGEVVLVKSKNAGKKTHLWGGEDFLKDKIPTTTDNPYSRLVGENQKITFHKSKKGNERSPSQDEKNEKSSSSYEQNIDAETEHHENEVESNHKKSQNKEDDNMTNEALKERNLNGESNSLQEVTQSSGELDMEKQSANEKAEFENKPDFAKTGSAISTGSDSNINMNKLPESIPADIAFLLGNAEKEGSELDHQAMQRQSDTPKEKNDYQESFKNDHSETEVKSGIGDAPDNEGSMTTNKKNAETVPNEIAAQVNSDNVVQNDKNSNDRSSDRNGKELSDSQPEQVDNTLGLNSATLNEKNLADEASASPEPEISDVSIEYEKNSPEPSPSEVKATSNESDDIEPNEHESKSSEGAKISSESEEKASEPGPSDVSGALSGTSSKPVDTHTQHEKDQSNSSDHSEENRLQSSNLAGATVASEVHAPKLKTSEETGTSTLQAATNHLAENEATEEGITNSAIDKQGDQHVRYSEESTERKINLNDANKLEQDNSNTGGSDESRETQENSRHSDEVDVNNETEYAFHTQNQKIEDDAITDTEKLEHRSEGADANSMKSDSRNMWQGDKSEAEKDQIAPNNQGTSAQNMHFDVSQVAQDGNKVPKKNPEHQKEMEDETGKDKTAITGTDKSTVMNQVKGEQTKEDKYQENYPDATTGTVVQTADTQNFPPTHVDDPTPVHNVKLSEESDRVVVETASKLDHEILEQSPHLRRVDTNEDDSVRRSHPEETEGHDSTSKNDDEALVSKESFEEKQIDPVTYKNRDKNIKELAGETNDIDKKEASAEGADKSVTEVNADPTWSDDNGQNEKTMQEKNDTKHEIDDVKSSKEIVNESEEDPDRSYGSNKARQSTVNELQGGKDDAAAVASSEKEGKLIKQGDEYSNQDDAEAEKSDLSPDTRKSIESKSDSGSNLSVKNVGESSENQVEEPNVEDSGGKDESEMKEQRLNAQSVHENLGEISESKADSGSNLSVKNVGESSENQVEEPNVEDSDGKDESEMKEQRLNAQGVHENLGEISESKADSGSNTPVKNVGESSENKGEEPNVEDSGGKDESEMEETPLNARGVHENLGEISESKADSDSNTPVKNVGELSENKVEEPNVEDSGGKDESEMEEQQLTAQGVHENLGEISESNADSGSNMPVKNVGELSEKKVKEPVLEDSGVRQESEMGEQRLNAQGVHKTPGEEIGKQDTEEMESSDTNNISAKSEKTSATLPEELETSGSVLQVANRDNKKIHEPAHTEEKEKDSDRYNALHEGEVVDWNEMIGEKVAEKKTYGWDESLEVSEDVSHPTDHQPPAELTSMNSLKEKDSEEEMNNTVIEKSIATTDQTEAVTEDEGDDQTDVESLTEIAETETHTVLVDANTENTTYHEENISTDRKEDTTAEKLETEAIEHMVGNADVEVDELADKKEIPAAESDLHVESFWLRLLLGLSRIPSDVVYIMEPLTNLWVSLLPEEYQSDVYGVSWKVIASTFFIGFFLIWLMICKSKAATRKRQYEHSEQTIKELRSQLENMSQEKIVAENELRTKQNEVEMQREEINNETQLKQTVAEEKQVLEQSLAKSNDDNVNLKRDLQILTQGLKEKDEQLQEVLNNSQQVEKSLVAQQEAIARSEETISRLQTLIAEHENHKQSTNVSTEKLKERMKMLEKSKGETKKEGKILKDQIEKMNIKVGELQERLDAELEENEAKKQEIDILKDCILQFKGAQEYLADDAEDVDSEKAIENQKDKLKSLIDVANVKATLRQTEAEKLQVTYELEAERKSRLDIEGKVSELEATINSSTALHNKLEKDKQMLDSKLTVMQEFYAKREVEIQSKLGLEQSKRESNASMLEDQQQKQLELLQQLDAYKKMSEEAKQKYEDAERQHKQEVLAFEKKSHENWLACRSTERKLEESTKQINQLHLELTDARHRLQDREPIIRPRPERHGPPGAPPPFGPPLRKPPPPGLPGSPLHFRNGPPPEMSRRSPPPRRPPSPGGSIPGDRPPSRPDRPSSRPDRPPSAHSLPPMERRPPPGPPFPNTPGREFRPYREGMPQGRPPMREMPPQGRPAPRMPGGPMNNSPYMERPPIPPSQSPGNRSLNYTQSTLHATPPQNTGDGLRNDGPPPPPNASERPPLGLDSARQGNPFRRGRS